MRLHAVGERQLYENRLIVGGMRGCRRWLGPLIRRQAFDHAHGMSWRRHNLEEVGLLEQFHSDPHDQETGVLHGLRLVPGVDGHEGSAACGPKSRPPDRFDATAGG
jgi:hypothetical protein